jgi:magnesium transporter
VVTVRRGECPAVASVHERLEKHHARDAASPQIVIVYLIMESLVNTFFPVLSAFDDKIDDLEDDILKAPTEDQLGILFDMKRGLMEMRKVIAPQRDMMASINSGIATVPGMTDEASRYFRDLYDHLIRLADLVDSYRDLLSSVMDTHLSTVSNRLNVVMKQLAIIATVFLPLSFLTGFFGQNFNVLVNHYLIPTWTFWVLGMGTEVIAVVLLMVLFRRRGWLGGPTV